MGYRNSLRERFDHFFLGTFFNNHIQEVASTISSMNEASHRGHFLITPHMLEQQLMEDSRLVDFLTQRAGLISYLNTSLTEYDRSLAIERHRYMDNTDVNIGRAVKIWTDFGMGQRVSVHSDNDKVNAILQEFWKADRNSRTIGQRSIHDRSDDVLNEGEIALVFWYSPINGKSSVRKLSTTTLKVIFEDVDKTIPVLYLQTQPNQKVVAYRDWLADDSTVQRHLDALDRDVIFADDLSNTMSVGGMETPLTKHKVLWATKNRHYKLGRGLPQFLKSLEYADTLKNFLGDRAAIEKKANTWTDKVKIGGGSRELNKFVNRQEQNHGGTGNNRSSFLGSSNVARDWIENESVTREWMQRDTGASAARWAARLFASQFSVDSGVGLHWIGFPDALSNRSTAEEILRPFWQQIERYQVWWVSYIEDMCRIVLTIMSDIGNFSDITPEMVQESIQVSLETPLAIVLEEITMLFAEVRGGVTDNIIPLETGQELLKQLILITYRKIGVNEPEKAFDMAVSDDTLADRHYNNKNKSDSNADDDDNEDDKKAKQDAMEMVLSNYEKGDIEERAVVDYLAYMLKEVL